MGVLLLLDSLGGGKNMTQDILALIGIGGEGSRGRIISKSEHRLTGILLEEDGGSL